MQILLGILDSIRRGISWALGTFSNSLIWYEATYAPLTNASFFAIGESSSAASTSTYNYSTDGITWTAGTLPASARWHSIVTNGSRIIVFGNNRTTGYYSDNGTTWTLTGTLNSTNAYDPYSSLWDGTRFVVAEGSGTGSNGSLFYSTNGATWSIASTAISGFAVNVGYDGVSRYIVITNNSDTIIRTTTTFPTGWTNASLPIADRWGRPIYGNGIWLIARPGNTGYATSTNGTTWTSRSLPALNSETLNDRYNKFLFTDNKFYFYSPDNVYSSTDGITWVTDTTLSASTLDNVTGWAAGPNKVIGVGYDSNSAATTTYLNGSR